MKRDPALLRRIREALADPELGRKVRRATDQSAAGREGLRPGAPEWNALRERCRSIRLRGLLRLDRSIEELDAALRSNGAHLHVARDGTEACAVVHGILEEAGARLVIKSKSMTTEEVGLNSYLEAHGMTVTETDLGELIVQLAGEAPSHVTGPAIHRSMEDIAGLFREKGVLLEGDGVPDVPPPPGSEERALAARRIALAARRHLRPVFRGAVAGISGANLVAARDATVVVVENEANARLTTTLPDIHVVLVGVEKVIPSLGDAAPILASLAPAATGQRQSSYVSFIGRRIRSGMHVVLLDGGRTRLLADREQRDLLTCVRCGACMNVCPVYREIGGHAYGGTYPGPIGAALLPHLLGTDGAAALPFLSSLCGACSEACPAGIPIDRRLVQLRARLCASGGASWLRSLPYRAAATALSRPGALGAVGATYRAMPGFARRLPPLRRWAATREPPPPPRESFRRIATGEPPGRVAASTTGTSPQPRVDVTPVPRTRAERGDPGLAGLLARIRAAVAGGGAPAEEPVADVPRPAEPVREDLVRLFRERVLELGARDASGNDDFVSFEEVTDLAALATVLRRRIEGLSRSDILFQGEAETTGTDRRIGIGRAAFGLAASGGLVLDLGSADAGHASLLVDTQIAVLGRADVLPDLATWVGLLPELRASGRSSGYEVVVTGASRTADIEKVLVMPAHGPRRLEVILVGGNASPPDDLERFLSAPPSR